MDDIRDGRDDVFNRIVGLFMLFLTINSVGFFAWAAYQLSTKFVFFELPTIPLMAGLAMWWLLMLTVYVPIVFLIAFKYQLNVMTENKRAEETNRILKSINKIPQKDISGPWKNTDDTFKH